MYEMSWKMINMIIIYLLSINVGEQWKFFKQVIYFKKKTIKPVMGGHNGIVKRDFQSTIGQVTYVNHSRSYDLM